MVEINPYEIIMQVINFGILLWLLNKFLFTPLGGFLEKRSQEIADNIDESKQAQQEAQTLLDESKEEVAKSKLEAKRIVTHAIETGTFEKKKMMDNAEQKVKELLVYGKEEVKREVQKAKVELKNQIADISIDIASKVLEKKIDKDSNDQLIKDHLYEISELK
jgi:F-type H+-transporting ATPase subunit b